MLIISHWVKYPALTNILISLPAGAICSDVHINVVRLKSFTSAAAEERNKKAFGQAAKTDFNIRLLFNLN